MKKEDIFIQTYFNIIKQSNTINFDLNQLGFDWKSDYPNIKDYYKEEDYKNSSFDILEDFEIPNKIQLTQGKKCHVTILDEIIIPYSIEKGQTGDNENPDYPTLVYIDGNIFVPFVKDLNSKENDDVIEIQLLSDDGKVLNTPKFTQLSLQDRYLILKGIDEFINTENDKFSDWWYDELEIVQPKTRWPFYGY